MRWTDPARVDNGHSAIVWSALQPIIVGVSEDDALAWTHRVIAHSAEPAAYRWRTCGLARSIELKDGAMLREMAETQLLAPMTLLALKKFICRAILIRTNLVGRYEVVFLRHFGARGVESF